MISKDGPLLVDVTTTGAGEIKSPVGNNLTFQAYGKTATGSGAVSVDIEVSLDQVHWEQMLTISLTLTTSDSSDGYKIENSSWKYIRANVTSISGTGAEVSCRYSTGGFV